jgi:hypothetical protein
MNATTHEQGRRPRVAFRTIGALLERLTGLPLTRATARKVAAARMSERLASAIAEHEGRPAS